MSGIQDIDNIWNTLEENLALLISLLTGDKNDEFKFDDFLDGQARNDLLNLYYVTTTPDPATAIEDFTATDNDTLKEIAGARSEFIRNINSGDKNLTGSILTSMSETLNTLKKHNISLDTNKTLDDFDDLMDFEELSFETIETPGKKGKTTTETVLATAAAEGSVKSEMSFDDFYAEVLANKVDSVNTQREGFALADEMHQIMKAKHLADDEKLNRHDKEFYEGVDIRTELAPKNISNLRTMDRAPSRVNFARMYMLSKGDSFEQIYADTPEAQELRKNRGKELMGIMHGGPKGIGKMFADMSKALSEYPMPDVSNDAALCKNRDEIWFIANAGINFVQVMGKESNAPVRDAYKKAAGSNFKSGELAVRRAMCLQTEGVLGRIDIMAYEDYSPSIAVPDKKNLVNSQRPKALFEADYYVRNTQRISELFQPGVPLGKGSPADELEGTAIMMDTAPEYGERVPNEKSPQATAVLRDTLPKTPKEVESMREAIAYLRQNDPQLPPKANEAAPADPNRVNEQRENLNPQAKKITEPVMGKSNQGHAKGDNNTGMTKSGKKFGG